MGTLLDETVKAGASRIDGVSFTATPEAISIAQKEALRKATIDAQAMADTVLNTLSLTSKEIVSIQVNGASVPPPKPIPVGQIVRASVTLQISY